MDGAGCALGCSGQRREVRFVLVGEISGGEEFASCLVMGSDGTDEALGVEIQLLRGLAVPLGGAICCPVRMFCMGSPSANCSSETFSPALFHSDADAMFQVAAEIVIGKLLCLPLGNHPWNSFHFSVNI